MMLRLSSRFALRTGWFECSAHFLRRGYANFDNTRYDSVRSVRAWMPDREIKRRSKCSRLSRFHFLTGIALPQLPDSKIEGISHRDHRSPGLKWARHRCGQFTELLTPPYYPCTENTTCLEISHPVFLPMSAEPKLACGAAVDDRGYSENWRPGHFVAFVHDCTSVRTRVAHRIYRLQYE